MRQPGVIILFFLSFIVLTGCGQNDSAKQGVGQNDTTKQGIRQTDTTRKKKEISEHFEAMIPPKSAGWVSDFETVFTPEQLRFLDSIIRKHVEKTSNEIAVVSLRLDSTTIRSSKEFDEFSLALFNKWGVGKKEKNNGIGILFSVHLRKIRIEVGYGLEAILTDLEAKNIIDTVIFPEFKKGNYFTGIVNALDRIFKEIE